MKYKICQICGLKSERIDGGKRFFMAKYPLDEERCKLWVKITGNEDLAYLPIEKLHEGKFVCGKHFVDKDFNKKKNRLNKEAIPSLRLTAKPLSDDILINFPYRLYREPQEIIEEVPPLSSPTTTLEVVKKTKNVNENLLINCDKIHESDIPQVVYVTEVCTSEHQQDISWNHTVPETGDAAKCRVIESVDAKTLPDIKTLKVAKKRKVNRNKNKSHSQQLAPRKKKKTSKSQNPHGNRWTENDKALAIAMFKKSRKIYSYLKHLVPLPSERILHNILREMPIYPGINNTVMNHLRRKANELTPKDRTCVIMFDEMSLEKKLFYNSANDNVEGFQDLGEYGRTRDIADKALVLLLQGVQKTFKQPLAHYFVAKTIPTEKLMVVIKNAITIVFELGFKVIATVCDQRPTYVSALNLLKKSTGQLPDSNFFLVENNKVNIIYDIPHLLKSIRNNFFKAGEIVFDGKKAKWLHLAELQEKNKETLHFKKITPSHVNPAFGDRKKVKLAAQIFSSEVAAILKLFAETFRSEQEYDGSFKRDAILQTAEVIEQLDKLFDITNGPASKKDIKRGIRVNVSKNSIHHKLWPEFKNKISLMHFLNSESQVRQGNVRCLNGYYISISSLQDIWNYCRSIGFKYLNLRQLNQDALENLFGLIRQHCPRNKNPTCQQFTATLKTSILTKLSTPIKDANCENDDNQLLIDVKNLVFQNSELEDIINREHSYTVSRAEYDYDQSFYDENDPVLPLSNIENDFEASVFTTFDKQPVVYLSGYLASVLIKRTNCHNCTDSLRTTAPGNDEVYDYEALKEWWKDRSSLTYPTLELCKTVDTCISVFERDVRHILHNKGIGKYCQLIMLRYVNLSWLCETHNTDLMNMLLSRLTAMLIRIECRKIYLSIGPAKPAKQVN